MEHSSSFGPASLAQPECLFINSLGYVESSATAPYLAIRWQSAAAYQSADLYALYETALLTLQQRGHCRLLIDYRHLAPLSLADQAWLADRWMPLAVESVGTVRMAILPATDVFARLSADTFGLAVRSLPVRLCSFTDETAALVWLLSEQAKCHD